MKKLKKLKLHDLEASCDLLSPFEQKRIMGGKDDIFDIQGGRIAEQNGGVLLTTTDGYSFFFDGVRLTDDWVIGETAYQLNGMIHISYSWIYAKEYRFCVNDFLHEFGHYLQQLYYGSTFSYLYHVGIPSGWSCLTDPKNHQNQPYEKDATTLGREYFEKNKKHI